MTSKPRENLTTHADKSRLLAQCRLANMPNRFANDRLPYIMIASLSKAPLPIDTNIGSLYRAVTRGVVNRRCLLILSQVYRADGRRVAFRFSSNSTVGAAAGPPIHS
jgi:hypothetical protein